MAALKNIAFMGAGSVTRSCLCTLSLVLAGLVAAKRADVCPGSSAWQRFDTLLCSMTAEIA